MTSRTIAGHPSGLFLLFFVEMWERFSYYGMRALLILYLVADKTKGGLGWSERSASELYGWYTGLVYLTPILGGWLADRYIGTRRSLVIGGLTIAAGHFALAFDSMSTFYLGLLLIIIGTGFFKPNVSTLVGQLYSEGDRRRDAGFTIFYMGINLGAFIGTLICGYLGESPDWGWHYGFGAAGVGMVLGLINYAMFQKSALGDIGLKASTALTAAKTTVAAAAAAAAPQKLTSQERDRTLAVFIVAAFVIFFWVAYEQAGSSMSLFAKNHTDRFFMGIEWPASWFQMVNPIFIIALTPVAAWLWTWLGSRSREPSTINKLVLGLLLLGIGFVCMVIGARSTAGGALASPIWLLAAFFFHTAGEICLSPVGLSLVTKLAPVRYASLLMGVWFLSNFAANVLGGYMAGALRDIEAGVYGSYFGGQADFFLIFVVTSIVAGAVLFLTSPVLKRLMHGFDRSSNDAEKASVKAAV